VPSTPSVPATPSTGLPKLQAVARAAGVSVSTVSKVLNGRPDVAPATRRRVGALLGQAGYPDVGGQRGRGGRRGRGGARNLIEVVMNWLDDTLTTELLRAVCLEAYARGMGVVVTDVESAAGRVGHPPRRWLEAMDARGAEAVISLLMDFSEAQLSYFEAHGVRACTLRTDERDLGRAAVRHLLELGHMRIAVVADPRHERVAEGCREALSGAEEAPEAAEGAAAEEPTPPSAIVFVGEDAARAGCAAIAATGLRVPHDVSVICCGLGAGEPDLPITAVVQPWDEMARAALDAVSGEQRAASVITMPPRVADQGSTAAARAAG
jgi:LacI family transcriptional regulator